MIREWLKSACNLLCFGGFKHLLAEAVFKLVYELVFALEFVLVLGLFACNLEQTLIEFV